MRKYPAVTSYSTATCAGPQVTTTRLTGTAPPTRHETHPELARAPHCKELKQ